MGLKVRFLYDDDGMARHEKEEAGTRLLRQEVSELAMNEMEVMLQSGDRGESLVSCGRAVPP